LKRRHARGERLGLQSFRFNGNSHANVRRKMLRRKAQEELALQRLAAWAVCVIDRATGETRFMSSDGPACAGD
jgi:hypothetical protein